MEIKVSISARVIIPRIVPSPHRGEGKGEGERR
jgi:hypothetical protein